MSFEHKIYEMEVGGRTLKVEIGKFANLANGSAMMYYGDTTVLVTATASRNRREGIDFFPLSVEFEEKMYSVGKIPGGFLKREGRPSDKAVLTARLIDRPIRPLFPDGMMNDVQIFATVMSVEQDNTPDTVGLTGANVALAISDIPFDGPSAAVTVGYVDGEYVINPTVAQREVSSLSLVVAGTSDAVVMVEAGADILPEEVMLEAILFGHEEVKKICKFIEMIASEIGKEKFEVELLPEDEVLNKRIYDFLAEKMNVAVRINDKHDRNNALDDLKAELKESLAEDYPDAKGVISAQFKAVEKEMVRTMISTEGLRPDGRGIEDIRAINCETNLLPRTHGSGMFVRGLTQALSITTLGALGEAQRIDGLGSDEGKRYMHHYNFPPYSVGETGFARVNRRAIGHGTLGERALLPVLPSEKDFPYAIRVVSEVLTCNGSSSQASICGSTLSLLDAGVPIKDSVAGIAMGLIQEKGKISILSDIQGMEDALGDMDFKVAGTKDGITALQMDIKVDGLSREILENALSQAKVGRMHILGKMVEVISAPSEDLSDYAPRVFSIQVHPDQIRTIIGPGGKMINKITSENDVKIDIDDEGFVIITAANAAGGKNALHTIEMLTKEVKAGEIYVGKVMRIMNFGAFVEILPGKEGLCHISKLDTKRVENVEDVVKVGDEITVKVMEIDAQKRINLSRKDVLLAEKKDK